MHSMKNSLSLSMFSDESEIHSKHKIKYFSRPKQSVFCENQSAITSSLLIANNILITGFHDGTIKEWDINTGECLYTYAAHSGSVYGLASINDHTFVSGGWDGIIKVWNRENKECHQVYTEHKSHVSAIQKLEKGLIASASYDGTIKVWDVNQSSSLYSICAHSNSIFCLAASKNLLASASGNTDQTIKLWDINERRCLQTFLVDDAYTGVLTFTNEDTLISGSGRTLRFWDIKTYNCSKAISGFDYGIHSLSSIGNSDLAVGSINRIIIFDGVSRNIVTMIFCHSDCVSSLISLPNGSLISAGNDGAIKVHNFARQDPTDENYFRMRSYSAHL